MRFVAIFCATFSISSILLVAMIFRLPSMPSDKTQYLKFPKTVEDLKALGIILNEYQDTYYWEVLLLISMTYIFLQSFMIPGSVLISILLGYLFPFPVALTIISLIQRYKHAMFPCICLLRICPLVPNWLVNISSPIVEIPWLHFFWGTLVGVLPLSLVFVKAGTVLQELTDIGVTSLASCYTLAILTVLSLLPFVFKGHIKRWFL